MRTQLPIFVTSKRMTICCSSRIKEKPIKSKHMKYQKAHVSAKERQLLIYSILKPGKKSNHLSHTKKIKKLDTFFSQHEMGLSRKHNCLNLKISAVVA